MANKTASVKITTTYTGPDAEQVVMPVVTVLAQYQAQFHGAQDVTDTLGASQDIELPFAGVDTEATLLIVENRTKNGANPGQPITLNINDGDIVVDIAIDGSYVHAYGGRPEHIGTPILSAKVTTTEIQAGPGIVSYHVFGDPVVIV